MKSNRENKYNADGDPDLSKRDNQKLNNLLVTEVINIICRYDL